MILSVSQAKRHAAQCGLSGTGCPLWALPDTFIAADDIPHPVTQQPLILAGFRYTKAQAIGLGIDYGIDYVTLQN